MIAAFWSNVGKKAGVTTNLACIGAYYAARYRKKLTVFENHLSAPSCGLRDAFLPRQETWSMVQEEPYYYDSHGIGQMMKLLRAGYELEFIEDVAIPLMDGRLNYLPLSENMCGALYEYELNRVIDMLLRKLDARSDLVMVDTQSAGNLTTKVILERADVVVVNLLQDPECVEDFFRRYGELAEKSLFLFGHYDGERVYNRVNLSRMYGIPEERLMTIGLRGTKFIVSGDVDKLKNLDKKYIYIDIYFIN